MLRSVAEMAVGVVFAAGAVFTRVDAQRSQPEMSETTGNQLKLLGDEF